MVEVQEGRQRLYSDGDDCVIPEPISIEDFKKNVPDESNSDQDPEGSETSSRYFSIAMGQKRKRDPPPPKKSKSFIAWKNAVAKARSIGDPWDQFHLEHYPTEKAIRHRYSGLRKEWSKDEVTVRMEATPFGHGAMRECFRLKKLSNFSSCTNWRLNANNAVAKRYMSPVDRQMYFEEVTLQMDAKLWGEEYSRHNPPKKVDFCQMAVLEFTDRPGKPLYHVENFIEGNYVKYNSNSGFVMDDVMRQTPQAFSHFTFERSGHQVIVVDIQGVGDLYTDPQIHTASGIEYGDGNLGTKGMALFFHSHQCNVICESLGLSKFDLATSETEIIRHSSLPSNTVLRGNEELCVSPSEYERTHLTEFLRMRSSSSIGSSSNLSDIILEDPSEEEQDENGEPSGLHFRCGYDSGIGGSEKKESHFHDLHHLQLPGRARRQRFISESSNTSTAEEERLLFAELLRKTSRPSRVADEVDFRKSCIGENSRNGQQSVLGMVHLALARYHELSRFTSPGDDNYDKNAALFHLRRAADCGVLEAVIAAARVHLQLPRNILEDIELPSNGANEDVGIDYMMQAAEAGDRAAIIFMAKAYDTGTLLGSRAHCWLEAVRLYTLAITALTENDEDGHFDGTMDDPKYQLVARQAEMYKDGGFGLEVDYEKSAELFNEAAEEATTAMKGRLASKYYALAEEVSALIE